MSEPEEENSVFPSTPKSTDHQFIDALFMDFDDLDDSSWPLDQISFINNNNNNNNNGNNHQLQPISPPFSSHLWPFADKNDDVYGTLAPLELSCESLSLLCLDIHSRKCCGQKVMIWVLTFEGFNYLVFTLTSILRFGYSQFH